MIDNQICKTLQPLYVNFGKPGRPRHHYVMCVELLCTLASNTWTYSCLSRMVDQVLFTCRGWFGGGYRFWLNNKSRMYLLENTGELHKDSHPCRNYAIPSFYLSKWYLSGAILMQGSL